MVYTVRLYAYELFFCSTSMEVYVVSGLEGSTYLAHLGATGPWNQPFMDNLVLSSVSTSATYKHVKRKYY